MIEMAPETARRCEEKREGRGLSHGQAVRHRSLQPFRHLKDMVFSPAYFVAKAKASYHFDQINQSGP